MELVFQDYHLQDNLISFTIFEKKINGICGNSKEELIDIINLKHNYKGIIKIDDTIINKSNIFDLKKRINIVYNIQKNWYSSKTIYEIMYYEIRRKKLDLKNPRKKIIDSLRIVGLRETLIEKSINTLSSSEQKKIQIAISLISNPSLIILEEPFKYLDKANKKQLIMLLQKIKDKYHKTIVIVSDDSNMLYQYTDHIIIAKNHKILIEGKSTDIFKRVDFLKKNRIKVPEIIYFTYLAKKKKQVKIDYHKDVRDIIKDIYKHV